MSEYKCWKDGKDLTAAVKAALEKIEKEPPVPVIAAAAKKVKIVVECPDGDENVFEIGKSK